MERKKQIRKQYIDLRNQLSIGQVQIHSQAVCERLMAWEVFLQTDMICFYHPLGNEVNLLAAAEYALQMGKQIGFPRTEGYDIRFYQMKTLENFCMGAFHVMEPPEAAPPLNLMAEGSPPLILVPGLVFDEKKHRMGDGKGYYDRFLAAIPQAVKAGISFELQVIEEVPVEPTDIVMDFMITEQRIW